ncbi:MAG TPA: heavy-metal-associated domain-containing protein [Longimicrobiales bacterium]|nr:heavy-metal-associated domain-containing protein [Longimicrobiales bacterium]
MATLLLKIENLSSENTTRIEEMLRAMPGVFGAVVSAGEGCAEVDIEDDEVSVDRIVARLREAGYPARISG